MICRIDVICLYKENNLICLNTKFQKNENKLWTHTYANGIKAQLDYVIVNSKWKNSVSNCQAFNSFENVRSDHRIVTSTIRLSLRANTQYFASIKPSEINLYWI